LFIEQATLLEEARCRRRRHGVRRGRPSR
jgi:hypothetical protein